MQFVVTGNPAAIRLPQSEALRPAHGGTALFPSTGEWTMEISIERRRRHLWVRRELLATSIVAGLAAIPALAQDAALQSGDGAVTLPMIDVSSGGPFAPENAVPANIPAVVQSVTAEQIKTQINAVTAAETLKYLPSIEVRERFIGDRNATISARTTGTNAGALSLVYADGLLISNLLGNSFGNSPRWQMVTPQEIARVDVIYGPFSALYPGNSLGAVVLLTTRMPEQLEFHAATKGFYQNFNLYGTHQDLPGINGSLSLGDRIDAFSYWLSFDHLDTKSQALSFPSAVDTTSTKGTPVTGAYTDINQMGLLRKTFGATSMEHSMIDMGKVKLAYDFTPEIRASYIAGLWHNRNYSSVQTYLTDLSGKPVYNTPNDVVTVDGKNYRVGGINPSRAQQLHLMQGLEAKSDTNGVFDFDAVVGSYAQLQDFSASANKFTLNDTGKITIQDGTGWLTADLRGIWRPDVDVLGRHEMSFGGHFDQYSLNQYVYNQANWLSSATSSLNGSSLGKTQTSAVYLQDAWSFLPQWKLVLGGRGEIWRAFDGANTNAIGTLNYPAALARAFSPKVSVSYEPTPDLLLRASMGKAYRFPTVNELFQQLVNSQAILVNNPNLLPEQVMAYDLTGEYAFENSRLRLTLFAEDRWNALISQTDTTVFPNITSIQNVGKVQFEGIEMAITSRDVVVPGFDLYGSVTYTGSDVLANYKNPEVIGNNWPRIPTWRGRATATYRPDDKLAVSIGARAASGAFNLLNNTDYPRNEPGEISPYLVFDARVNYSLDPNWTMAFGIDNINNMKYYVGPHPYPQRTLFAELRFDY